MRRDVARQSAQKAAHPCRVAIHAIDPVDVGAANVIEVVRDVRHRVTRSPEEQRRQDHVSRLVGLDGFRVKRVIEEGDQLALGRRQRESAAALAPQRIEGR